MLVRTDYEYQAVKEISQIVANCLTLMAHKMQPGMTGKELDDIGQQYLEAQGAVSAPNFCYDFPGATCISLNNCVAHGIPDDRPFKEGDLINIDVSAHKDGYFGDTGGSFILPPATPQQLHVCQATKKARNQAIKSLKADIRLNAIGQSVEKTARRYQLNIIRNLCSHGIGLTLHDAPGQIPSYYVKHDRRRLQKGQLLTVEPFLTTGPTQAVEAADGWSLMIPKGHLCAQYEHTILIHEEKAEILTIPNLQLD